jgi:indolepyruvate ferredoxin oxidoreductase beta subunit
VDGTITSIVFAGVGGQGVVLSTEVCSRAALYAGYDVKKTEVHGVAQRGGTVMSHVRFGTRVYSPLCPVGSVDILVALERLEGLRFSYYLKQGGTVIVNSEEIVPTRYVGEKVPYPPDAEALMKEKGFDLHPIDARALAREAGSRMAFNVVVLGALSLFLDFEEALWKKAIVESLPERLHRINLAAFESGRGALARSK